MLWLLMSSCLFDTVDRCILDCTLSRLGLGPGWFRRTYFAFHSQVRLRFKLAAGFGESWCRDVCPSWYLQLGEGNYGALGHVWGWSLLEGPIPAVLNLLDGPVGVDPAFHIVWSRFRMMRHFLAYCPEEEFKDFQDAGFAVSWSPWSWSRASSAHFCC